MAHLADASYDKQWITIASLTLDEKNALARLSPIPEIYNTVALLKFLDELRGYAPELPRLVTTREEFLIGAIILLRAVYGEEAITLLVSILDELPDAPPATRVAVTDKDGLITSIPILPNKGYDLANAIRRIREEGSSSLNGTSLACYLG